MQELIDITPDAVALAGDAGGLAALMHDLQAIRKAMLAAEAKLPAARAGASQRNLAHYLAFRRHDHRRLQQRLAELGLSSLGRAEPHVLANVDKVLQLLQRLGGECPAPRAHGEGQALQQRQVQALFGPAPVGRRTYIMVTLPSEAATDPALIPALVRSGMDVARINCAHDDAEAWIAMATRVREAAATAGRTVRVLMDLAGPKLRTGPIAPGPPVLQAQAAARCLRRRDHARPALAASARRHRQQRGRRRRGARRCAVAGAAARR